MSLAQLINCFLRCSGCNATIDESQVENHDEIADVLDLIQADMKTEVMPSYPLVTRSATFRNFRRRLSSWMEKLFVCIDEASIVYDDTMMETMTAWLSAMTSSSFRSMRHTSTLVSLYIVEQLNMMSLANRSEVDGLVKSRDAEKAKASANKIRLQDFTKSIKVANDQKKILDALIQEMFEVVFIHRYRDSDDAIRVECIDELGRWMKSYPDKYMQTTYFSYIGWSLSDMSEKVRLVAVKSLSNLYSRFEYDGSFQHFTERFLPRMIDMAVGDIDSPVRASVIATLAQIDEQDVLEEAARDSIASHIFDVEPRVRSAVAAYIKQLLDVQQRGGEDEEEAGEAAVEDGKLRWKLFAQLIARAGSKLEKGDTAEGSSSSNRSDEEVAIRLSPSTSSRLALAFRAVWDADEKLQDWDALLQLLLYDHSHQETQKKTGKKKGAVSSRGGNAPEKEEYRLEPSEESLLLEALPVVLERLQASSIANKDGAAEDVYGTMTRALIPVLAKLFKKYRTEVNRIAEVLAVVRYLKMDVYLEFQQIGSFESLWDEVIDQFLRHTEKAVLGNAIDAMTTMKQASAMSNVNETKMAFLRQTVFQSLQDSLEDDIDLENDELDEDRLYQLSACTSRILHLIRRNDLGQEMEENGDDHREGPSAADSKWDYLLAFARRGRLGSAKEAAMVSDSIVVLTLSMMWSARRLRDMEDVEEKEGAVTLLCDKRSRLLTVLNSLLDRESTATLPKVKRQAFRQLVDLHILFAALDASNSDNANQERSVEFPSLRLKCSLETQAELAAFVESELSSYLEENRASTSRVAESEGEEEEDDDGDDDDDDEEDGTPPTRKAKQKFPNKKIRAKTTGREPLPSLAFLQRQVNFVSTISHFISAIRLGIIHVKYSVGLLAKYSRIGHVYDSCLRVLVELLREVGINEDRPEQACSVVLDSLSEAHADYCREESAPESGVVNLAKMLSSSLVVRGAQLSIVKSVSGQAIVDMHNRGTRRALVKIAKIHSSGEGSKGKAQKKEKDLQALFVFFKALSQLLVGLGPREALAIKNNMGRLLVELDLDVPMTSKSWDPFRQYEKRLVTITSKSESVRKHIEDTRGQKKQSQQPQQQTTSRPKPRPSVAKQLQGEGGESDEDEREQDTLMEDSRIIAFGGSEADVSRDEQRLDLTMEDDEGEEEDDADGEEEEADEE
jgi:cohesin complex subunit SA-1/2